MHGRALVLAVLLALAWPADIQAVDLTQGYFATGFGCFECKVTSTSLSIVISERCWQVGDEEHGEGVQCREEYIWDGFVCHLPYAPCYHTVADGGGVDLQGGSECAVDARGSCDPSCDSCTVVYE